MSQFRHLQGIPRVPRNILYTRTPAIEEMLSASAAAHICRRLSQTFENRIVLSTKRKAVVKIALVRTSAALTAVATCRALKWIMYLVHAVSATVYAIFDGRGAKQSDVVVVTFFLCADYFQDVRIRLPILSFFIRSTWKWAAAVSVRIHRHNLFRLRQTATG